MALLSRTRGIAFLLALTLPATAAAEVYSWVDDEGVIYFTNVPPNALPNISGSPPARRLNDTENTFSWKDDLGVMRRIHKVDVTRYDALIREAARYYSLPPAFVKAVVAAESAFEPAAVSRAGALGLMQLMPKTAVAMRVRDVFDPRANVYGGVRYLRLMANRFAGDVRMTAAAYNAGPNAVQKAGGVPAIAETRTYVRRILKLYNHYLRHWDHGR